MTEKVTRDAFLYLPPKHGVAEDFAQCGPCRMFVPAKYLHDGMEGGRCIIHGSRVVIDEDDSCGFMVPWPTPDGSANTKVYRDHAAELVKELPGSVTPEQSGLVSRKVQCHRCRFKRNKEATLCNLFYTLTKKMPDKFDLDENIEPHACCNAQTPETKRESLYGKD
jgi:hypothetical protein